MSFPIVDGLRSIEFGTPGESRTRLINFVVNGHKRATAGLLSDYNREGEPFEYVGECLAMTGNDGSHVATLMVTRVDISRFGDVPDEFALAEAEGDLNAADFRASHSEYWTHAGETITDDTAIVQVYFDVLSHRLRALQESDAEWIHRACQDAEIQRWTTVPRPYTQAHAESFIRDKAGELTAFAITHATSNEPVGVAGIHHIRDGVATIGYWVAPWGRGRGAAAAAIHILATHAPRLGDAAILRAVIAETNAASRSAATRAGMRVGAPVAEQCPDGDQLTTAVTYELELPVSRS
jgi:uncharacterized protein YhfF/predicted acetyltransferase